VDKEKDPRLCRYEMCSRKATHEVRWPNGTKVKFCKKHGLGAMRSTKAYTEMREI
jgi:hypothetical protein